jgi:probable rRNA maturation factor
MAQTDGQGFFVTVDQTGDWPLPERLLENCVRCVGSREGASAGEISVTFLTDREIRALNLEYLGKDRPTDVIAFALHGSGDPPLGDVYVGYEQAQRQAREEGIEVEEELLRLAIHGALHVFGHDHPEGDERTANEMFRLQEEILEEVLSRP